SPLERILAQIVHHWHVGRRFFSRPTVRLLVELELEIVDADGSKCRAAEIKELAACRWSLAGEQVRLVVAVEMVLVGPAAKRHALKKLLRDVRIARRRTEGGEPIQSGEEAVLHAAGLDPARPADHARHAEAALEHRAFGGAERRHAAVGPGKDLGAVLGGE